MSNSEQYRIYQLLEPNDRLIVGNAKRWEPIKVPVIVLDKFDRMSEDEVMAFENEYLKQYKL